MKLTNYHRDAVIASVMNDLPKTEDLALKARNEAMAMAVAALPDVVRRAYKAYPDAIKHHWCELPYPLGNISLPVLEGKSLRDIPKSEYLVTLAKQLKEQQSSLTNLRAKVRAAMYAVNTLKQAREVYPEFAKYLPSETEPTKNLPALRGVVDDLAKAGWPVTHKAMRKAA